jgi:hypothetical protein
MTKRNVVHLFVDEVENVSWEEILGGRVSLNSDIDLINGLINKVLGILKELSFHRYHYLLEGSENHDLNEIMRITFDRLIWLSLVKVRRIALTKKG